MYCHELYEALLAADIQFQKLNNLVSLNFISKCSKDETAVEPTLRKIKFANVTSK